MLNFQYILNLHSELIVDLFAGGGGASTGIELATGRHVDIAVNHDPEAVAMHEMNHPQTRHFCEDVFQVDPRKVTEGRPVGLLWASPDCKHFSKAKGGRPVSKKIRSLAWVVVKWAWMVRPRIICLENVEEFQTWGPLKDDMPDPARKGETFKRWVSSLRGLGYDVEWRELRACDYGAPTIRKRLFLIARCDGQPIVWPTPTHGKGLIPYRTAADIIDWSIPCPSIFERRKPLSDNTLRRIAHGLVRFIIHAKNPYIYRINSQKASPTLIQVGYGDAEGRRVPGLDKPLGTVVSGGGKFALVSAFLAKHYGGVIGTPANTPTGTITTKDHHSLVTSQIVKMRGTNIGHPVDEPLQTISAGGTHFAEVRSFLTEYYGNSKDGFSIEEPLHTVTTRDRFSLVTIQIKKTTYAIADIGLRMLQPHELYAAQAFPSSYIFNRTDEKILSKSAQVRMCGNSVCPPVAAAVVRANYQPVQNERKL